MQMRREGQAAIEFRRAEQLMLAQTERDIEAVQRGELAVVLRDGRALLTGPVVAPTSEGNATPRIGREIEEVAIRNLTAEAMRKEVALAKAVLHAEEELRADASEPSDATISDDWLLRWRDSAAGVSSEELQMLWGKVLAGEVKSPGKYSLRTLDFIRILSQDDAKLIEKIAPLVTDGIIFRGNPAALEQTGVTFGELLELQDIGILKGVDVGLTITRKSIVSGSFATAFQCHGSLLFAKAADAGKTIIVPVSGLTDVGKQVMTLGTAQPNMPFLLALGEWLKHQGCDVEIGRYQRVSETQFVPVDMKPLKTD